MKSFKDDSFVTIQKLSETSVIGWVGLLRGEACETIQASTEIEAISIRSEIFIQLILMESELREYFFQQTNTQESWEILRKYLEQFPYQSNDLDRIATNACNIAEIKKRDENYSLENDYFLSSAQFNINSGTKISEKTNLEKKTGFVFDEE